jgi:predicted Zn-dependent protease
VAVLVAVAAAACATNPVTGESELSLISESQEVQMGQQAAQDVARSIGLVNDEGLQQYVQRIGTELARDSERPQLPWTFRVVDDPTPNAFALPGGYIFVTRGMMNLMTSEAELASVLGHEIGHVTAKHSVSQMSRQQLAQLGLGIGMILSEDLARYGQLAGAGLQLLFLKYGRDDERQADDLGFKYALNEGYDVREMDDVFQSLQRASAKEGTSPLPSWLATHPYPEERIRATQARVAALDRPLTGLQTREAEYLQQIDGLVYGENPRNGFFSGTSFLHPDLRFKVDFPSGWRAQNTPQAVVAMSPQQDAVIQLTLAGTGSPTDAARQFLAQEGVQAGQASQETINGLPAVASYFQAQTQQGVVRGLAVFLSHGGRTYQVLAFTPAQVYDQYDRTFRQTLGSFSQLTDPRALNVQPNKVDVVRLDQAMTLAAFNARYSSAVPIEELALINQVEGGSATLPAGSMVKRIVAGNGN